MSQDDESGKHRVLICSDDFARGMSIDTVRTVVNLDLPDAGGGGAAAASKGEDPATLYTHRIGRATRSETAHGMVSNPFPYAAAISNAFSLR